MMPLVQGVIAAATTACLYRQINRGQEKQETWENIALGANHLFLVANAALMEGSIQLPGFSLCAKAVFLLTPVVVIYSFSEKNCKITLFEKSIAIRFSQFYYLTTSVSSIAMIALGNRGYGIAALSIIAIDFVVHHKKCPRMIRVAFTVFLNTAAIATFIGYAARLSTIVGQTVMMLIGMTVFLPKIAKLLPEGDSNGEIPRKRKVRDQDDRKFMKRDYWDNRDCYHCPPIYSSQGVLPSGRPPRSQSPSFKEKAGTLVTSLPHDL